MLWHKRWPRSPQGRAFAQHAEATIRRRLDGQLTISRRPQVPQTWWQQRIQVNGEPADWVAAYRLLPGTDGPVIAEVRVFPFEAGATGGQWSAEKLGDDAKCPPGGVPASVLRAVKLSTPWAHLARAEREAVLRSWGERADSPVFIKRLDELTERGSSSAGERLLRLAQVARAYAEAAASDENRSSPRRAAAEATNYSPDHVRDLIRDARQEGLLTPPPGPRRPGGELTEKAKAILATAEAKGRTRR